MPDATSGDDAGMDATFGPDTSGPDVAPPPEDAPHDAPHDGFLPPPNEAGVDVLTMPDVVTLPDVVTMPDVISPPDAYVAPDACSGEVASDADAVFVKQGGSGTTCSMGAPCGRFQDAFAALGGKSKVYVAEGTYTESFNVPGGITVQGGWLDNGGSWQRDCSTGASATTIQSDGKLAYAVGYAASGTSTLDTLTIKSSGTASSVSVYGVFVNGTGQTSPVLDLINVFVTAADAVAGATGQKGGTGASGTGTCGQTNATCSTAGTGSTGGIGAVATASSYTSGGYVPGTGGTGQTGGTGTAGTTPPAAPACTTGDGQCKWNALGDNACDFIQTDSCGTQGTCGCPGGGGTGGTGGGGGGSSIALYVWSATLNVNGGSLSAGRGGDGGAGGAGGDGGSGDSGQPGNQGPCVYADCTGNSSVTCTGTTACIHGAAGAAGGTGGTGGKGGQGGGGNGGDSYAYFVGGGGAVASISAATSFKTGGAAGSPNGTGGHGATHN